ncbi:histidine kinase [Pseudotenacibaculum sp. MALMAid0570]|uniref:sensor histidine kinase n=1 Tax=Pseudotenacibaculum sp. MALMAid0570 TaxID=3143938 RepID=UPI0032DEB6D5
MQIENQPELQLTNNFTVKKHLFITLSGVIFGFFITYFIVLGDAVEQTVSLGALEISLTVVVGVSTAYLIYFSALKLDQLLPWQKFEGNRLLVGILLHFISSYFWILLLGYLSNKLFEVSSVFEVAYSQSTIKMGIVLLILIIIFEIIYFASYSYYSYTTFQIATVRQERKQIELQLKALKSQLSPHFLFNSLNTISSLVFKDKAKAEGFIRRLATMYQYTLHSYQKKLIPLQEELEFVNSYQYLLQTRFGQKFQCNINIHEELLHTTIPPLTLQMLIENAVKHNVLDEENPLVVQIESDNKYITVKNNITKKPTHVTSFQIGLKNINARYLLLHSEGIVVSNGENFEVKIPVIL